MFLILHLVKTLEQFIPQEKELCKNLMRDTYFREDARNDLDSLNLVKLKLYFVFKHVHL